MNEAPTTDAGAFRGIAEEVFEALTGSLRPGRLATAAVGLAMSLAVSGLLGMAAGASLLKNSLPGAALLGLAAAFAVYVGALLTYAALCRLAMADRVEESLSTTDAYGFAISRSHIVVGLPFFVLLAVVALASGLGWVGSRAMDQPGLGAIAPLFVLLFFAANAVLIVAAWMGHALTGPCVACIDQPFQTTGARVVQAFQERVHNFVAYQAAVILAAIPLLLVVGIVLGAAFIPAASTVGGLQLRSGAEAIEPAPQPPPEVDSRAIWGDRSPALEAQPVEQSDGWTERLQSYLAGRSLARQLPLIAASAVVLLVLLVGPLVFVAEAESAVYLGLTGDMPKPAAAVEPAVSLLPARPRPREKHPPITHCWRCDAINRFGAETCTKCGAALATCSHCFSTSPADAETCAVCGEPLEPEPMEDGAEKSEAELAEKA